MSTPLDRIRHALLGHTFIKRYSGLETQDGRLRQAFYQWCSYCADWIAISPVIVRRPGPETVTLNREFEDGPEVTVNGG